MKPKHLVYILVAIIIAFVLRGYFAAEEVQLIVQAVNQGHIRTEDNFELKKLIFGGRVR